MLATYLLGLPVSIKLLIPSPWATKSGSKGSSLLPFCLACNIPNISTTSSTVLFKTVGSAALIVALAVFKDARLNFSPFLTWSKIISDILLFDLAPINPNKEPRVAPTVPSIIVSLTTSDGPYSYPSTTCLLVSFLAREEDAPNAPSIKKDWPPATAADLNNFLFSPSFIILCATFDLICLAIEALIATWVPLLAKTAAAFDPTPKPKVAAVNIVEGEVANALR